MVVRLPVRKLVPHLVLSAMVWMGALWQLGYGAAPKAVFALLSLPALVAGYVVAVGMINRWTVLFDPNVLNVASGPLPWWGERLSLPSHQVAALGLNKTLGRHGRPSTYMLEVRLQDGRTSHALRGLSKPAAVKVLDVLMAGFKSERPDDQTLPVLMTPPR